MVNSRTRKRKENTSAKREPVEAPYNRFALLASFVNPILVFAPDLSIRYVNRAFEEMTGFTLAELAGRKPPYPWFPPGDTRLHDRRLKHDIRLGISQFEHLFQTKDGREFWVTITLTPVVRDAKVTDYVSNWIDITKQKLRHQRETDELYQMEKKLRQKLEREIAMRGQFFRMLVHELKTPLSATLISSDLLCGELKDETYLTLARNIHRSVSTLTARIDELMDLSKGEMGLLKLHFRSVNINPVIQQIADEINISATHNGKTFSLDVPEHLPHIWCDESRVRQILMNLLNNSVKFTEPGGHITLRARAENNHLVISVEDNGPGIPKSKQKLLFTPYFRAESSKEHHGGLGLGLYLCKIMADLHRGRIEVDSRAGKGSKFRVYLPLKSRTDREAED